MYCNRCGTKIDGNGMFCEQCGNRVKQTPDNNYVYEFQSPIFSKMTSKIYLWMLPAVASFIMMGLNYIQINNASSIEKVSGYDLIMGQGISSGTAKAMLVILIINNVFVVGTALIGKYMNYILARFFMVSEVFIYLLTSGVTYYNLNYEVAKTIEDKIMYETGIGCYLNITIAVSSIILYYICNEIECCMEIDHR